MFAIVVIVPIVRMMRELSIYLTNSALEQPDQGFVLFLLWVAREIQPPARRGEACLSSCKNNSIAFSKKLIRSTTRTC